MKGWVAFDLDGTLAFYTGYEGPAHIGEPVKPMLEKLKFHLSQGHECRIFTARVYPLFAVWANDDLDNRPVSQSRADQKAIDSCKAIREWCKKHVGKVLTITCVKDYGMVRCYDDRACQVIPNTGVLLESLVSQLQAELDKIRASTT